MPTKVVSKKAVKALARPAKKVAAKPATAVVARKAVAKKVSAKPTAGGKSNANNERLRALVERQAITQEESLKRFNVGFGINPVSMNAWKSYFVDPSSARHRHFGDILLAHAEKKLGA